MAIGRTITQTPGSLDPWVDPAEPATPIGLWLWLERTLAVLGVLCLIVFLYPLAESRLYQSFENRELDAILASAPALPATARRLPPPAPGSTVGRIEIPRLGVSAVIRAGSDARTLRLAVGHIPGTALPGEVGNIGLAAHRDTFFRRLRDIRAQDEIRVVSQEGTFAFRVEKTSIVSPRDTFVLDPTPHRALTLVTCYPFTYVGAAPERFIVHAVAANGPARP